jgi:C4-dicarboxylate-specific signal transduction histidine kinase
MVKTSVLGRRLLLNIICFSFFITLMASGIIIYSDYRAGIKQISSSISRIEAVYLPSISFSLWNYDYNQLLLQLKGINNFPGVVACQVIDEKGHQVQSFGEIKNHEIVEQYHFPLTYNDQGITQPLGKLIIAITKEEVYKNLIDKIIVIIGSQFFKTITVSLFILFLVYKMITRHLNQMSNWARNLDIENFNDILLLDRSPLNNDELSVVTNAINQLRNKVSKYHIKINESKAELETLNQELESRVSRRTEDLNNMISRLNETIEELQTTQNKLIEAEKHAALGQLVAGVAHEINTPLGLCVTTQSYIADNISAMQEKVAQGQLSKEEFVECYHTLTEGMGLLKDNLSKASHLINSFKQVAVDTSAEKIEMVNIRAQIEVAKAQLNAELSSGNYHINIDCSSNLEISSYPNAICTLFHTLIQNSLKHAFSDNKGEIYIDVSCSEDTLELHYKDSGKGLSKDVANKIFDPFFTTSRSEGAAGLGMHTLHNIVTQILAGTITCTPSEQGAFFQVIIKNFKASVSLPPVEN